MNIYVGNLSYDVQEQQLRDLFSEFGAVRSVKIISDNATGRSKGFAFVEMESDADGEQAIAALDGTEFSGRKVVVNPARPRQEGGGGGGGGRRFEGGGGGGHRGGGREGGGFRGNGNRGGGGGGKPRFGGRGGDY